MAVPVRLRSMPEHIRAPHLAEVPGFSSISCTNGSDEQQLLQFPKSSCVLWDGTSTGQPVFLHVAQNRKPKIHISEKVLWLIHRQCENEGSSSRVLVASLSVDDDTEGVWFHIDGLDTRQSGGDSSMALGDVMIPVQVSNSTNQDRTGCVEDYLSAIEMLKKRVCGRDALELSSLLLVKGWCGFYSNGHSDKTVAHLQFDVVTMATVLKATPVNAVPIVPTALAKNLAGPRNLSHLQGRPKCGYLTMDHTRKLLLVLESDPKVSSLPIVGIWVSGVSMVQHPFVWTTCLRYLHSEQLHDRVCTPPEGFLLVLYSPLHSKPEFYEVFTTSGKNDLQFDLFTGYEITSFYKKSSGPDSASVQWEVSPVRNGPKRELFDAAIGEFHSHRNRQQGGSAVPSNAVTTAEDIMPRSTPAPHRAKAMVVRPMVPEVSMLWSDDSQPAAYAPFPSASTSNGPVPTSFTFGTASSPVLSSSKANLQTFVNDVVLDSSNSHQLGKRFPQQSGTLRHQMQDRTLAPNTGAHSGVGEGYSFGSSPQANMSQQLRAAAPQHFNNHLSLGYPVPQPQGQPPVPSSAMYQPHAAPSHPVPLSLANGNEQSHMVALSSTCSNQHQHLPIVAQYGSDQRGQQHSVPLSSAYGPTPPRPVPPPSMQAPHLLPPSAFHLCRPNLVDNFQHSSHVPHSVQCSQGHSQLLPSRNSASTQGIPINQQMQFNKPQAQMARVWLQAGQLSSGGLPFEHFNQKAAMSHAPAFQWQTPHPQMSSQMVLMQQEQFHKSHQYQGGCHQITVPKTDQCSGHEVAGSYAQYSSMPSGTVADPSPLVTSNGEVSTGFMISFPPTTKPLRDGNQQVGSDTTQADSTSCSGKSSDDSGLSITPDRSNPSPKPLTSPGESGDQDVLSLGVSGRVNWEGVPPEVVQLLVQQDTQLKILQAQIQQLLTQQQQSSSPASNTGTVTPTPTTSSTSSTPSTVQKAETCSIAVNTTMFCPEPPFAQSHPTQYTSVQTSPLKHQRSDSASSRSNSLSETQNGTCTNPFDLGTGRQGPTYSPYVDRVRAPTALYRVGTESSSQTPSDIRHQGVMQLSSTRREEEPVVSSLSIASIPDVSLEQQQHQGHSSPARAYDSPQQGSMLSHSTPSPQSASMCVHTQEGDASRDEEVSPDSKEYYDQLISNIRLFLNNHSKDAEDAHADCSELPSGEESYTPLKLMESTIQGSHTGQSCPSGGASTNTTLLPYINYLSMMLESETDTSVEINAMAMKYLRDEQLTQMALLRQGGATSFTGGNLLRQVLAASTDATSMSDTSRLGASANNMSMATKKYLEKYGLMGAGDESIFDTNQIIRLQTDFSMAATSEPGSGPSLPSSPQKAAARVITQNSPLVRSPVKKEVLQPHFHPSPAISEEAENSFEDRRRVASDLGASPVLRAPGRQQYDQNTGHRRRESSPEDTPIFPERYRGVHTQNIRTSECSTATEDDCILDIEKLKQMPKLL